MVKQVDQKSSFKFETDISKALTIPSDWYFSEGSFNSDRDELFLESWNLVGHLSQISKKGDFFTATVGKENFVIVNDAPNGLRGYFNVCRHRAGPVALGSGNSTVLKCLYHGWTYNLQGELIGAPDFQGVQNFKNENCGLPKAEVKTWGPFVFLSAKPKVSFEVFIGGIPESLSHLFLDKMIPFETKNYFVECNWKVYVDNYLEGYHLPAVHKELFRELDYSKYETITHPWYSIQRAPARETAALYNSETSVEAYYYWLFPNLMLNIYQGILQTNVVIPTGPKSCTVKFEWFTDALHLHNSQVQIQELISFSDRIQDEDRVICEAVQRNLESASYSQGRYSVKRENGVHHFHGLISKFKIS